MKLIRFGLPGAEKPGVVDDQGRRVDASVAFHDYDETFFANGGLTRLQAWFEAERESAPVVPDSARLGPPIARPSKIVCVGLNYRDHAAESKLPVPTEPVLFSKASTSLAGPYDDVIIPRGASKLDWEVELAVVIGRQASYVDRAKAAQYIAGYVLHNDYSERSFQLERSGQWFKGKSADTFAPLGPWLVTPDELPDINDLRLWLSVNGNPRQDGTTRDLVFDVPALVSYISQFMTLLPGDLISTGTPAGVGLGMSPPTYLAPGDVVELGIDGLGSARQTVRAYESRGGRG